MYTYRGKYVVCEIPEDVYKWPANREEIQNRVQELNAIIDSMATGKTQPWPGTEKTGSAFVLW